MMLQHLGSIGLTSDADSVVTRLCALAHGTRFSSSREWRLNSGLIGKQSSMRREQHKEGTLRM